MPVHLPDLEGIRGPILRDIRNAIDGADTKEGTDYFVVSNALANALLGVYANGEVYADRVFPDTSDEEGLKKHGQLRGIAKLGAQHASGTATASASFSGASLPDESFAVNPVTSVRYKTVGITTTTGASPQGTAYLVALDAGVSGNLEDGDVLQLESPPPGFDPLLTVVSIRGGEAAWSNERWALEILRAWRQRPQAGNAAHVLALAHAIPGVEHAFVYRALRGRGTLDVIILTAAATGSRVAGTALLARVAAALQLGARPSGGDFVPGLPEDTVRNARVHAVVEQATNIVVGFRPPAGAPFASWPPYGAPNYVVPGDTTTWYRVSAASSLTSFRIAHPLSGVVVAPTVGAEIGVFFPSKGFCKATIKSVSAASGAWDVTVGGWSPTPTESSPAVGATITPWSTQLTSIAGAPASDSLALSGAVPEYFATLGPGEMTALTDDDESLRRRWPRLGETNPITGEAEWPTDVTARLLSAVVRATKAIDASVAVASGSVSTPDVPPSAYLGTPPSVLVLGVLHVIPMR